MITLEKHNGITVLRDDLLTGGTKSILMPSIIGEENEYVYASPVYGGFQIALSAYCQKVGKKATIFCAKRKVKHDNTLKCIEYGANIIEVPYGYLSVVEKQAKDYCEATGAKKLVFGANSMENKILIGNRMREIIKQLDREPKEIWCAIGSGTLVDSILMATDNAKVYGVQVGAEYKKEHDRLTVLKYHKSFDKVSKHKAAFQSVPNYDLKAFEYCEKYKSSDDVFFWNVL
jgi:threonine dehydratase